MKLEGGVVMETAVKGDALSTRFVTGDEVQAGDVIVDEEGNEKRVTFSVLEGGRNHLDVEGEEDTIIVNESDVIEIKCGPGES